MTIIYRLFSSSYPKERELNNCRKTAPPFLKADASAADASAADDQFRHLLNRQP
jgi:hypothetical protein